MENQRRTEVVLRPATGPRARAAPLERAVVPGEGEDRLGDVLPVRADRANRFKDGGREGDQRVGRREEREREKDAPIELVLEPDDEQDPTRPADQARLGRVALVERRPALAQDDFDSGDCVATTKGF